MLASDDPRMPARFLIVRLDGLGDTLLMTPMLAALRAHWTGSHVCVIASPAGAACLQGHPGVDEVIVFSPGATTLGDKLALGRRLRAARFDVALSVTEKAWAYLWLRMSGAPRRVAFWAGAEKPLKSLLFAPTVTDRVDEVDGLHETDRHMQLLAPLGLSQAAGPLWSAREKGPGNGPIALHLSHKWVADGWRDEAVGRVIEGLAAEHECGVLLTAGTLESAWARTLCAALEGHARIDTLLEASYDAWTRALAGCRLMVSMDTGAVHVAASLGLPVVDVFPAHGAAACVPRWRPWMVEHAVVLREAFPTVDAEAQLVQEILQAARSLICETA